MAKNTKPAKTIYIEIKGGCLQGIYGDRLDTKEQIMFVVRDLDNVSQGDEDPTPENYKPETHYW